jgi:hypothetical protein
MMMAALNSTSKARAGRNRASKGRIDGAKPRIPTVPSLDRSAFREGLIKHIHTIRDAMYVVIVCCAASREQNADLDTEISSVLQLYGGNKLSKAVQEAGMLLALFDGKTDIDPEGDEIGRLADPANADNQPWPDPYPSQ